MTGLTRPFLDTQASYTKGLPASRPAGIYKREHRITEGGAHSENPNVQAATLANQPGRGLSASAPKTLLTAPSSAALPAAPTFTPSTSSASSMSPLTRSFTPQAAPAVGTPTGQGEDIDELLKMIIG